MDTATEQDKKKIATNILYLVIMGEIDGLALAILNNPRYSNLFSDYEIQELKKEAIPEQLEIPKLLITGEWDDEDELFHKISKSFKSQILLFKVQLWDLLLLFR